MIDLNTMIDDQSGWVLQAAYAINDNGVIVGEGKLNGTPRAFRLTPALRRRKRTSPRLSWRR